MNPHTDDDMSKDMSNEMSNMFGRFAAHAPQAAEGYLHAKQQGPDALHAWCAAHGFSSSAQADAWLHDRAARSWLAWRDLQRGGVIRDQ